MNEKLKQYIEQSKKQPKELHFESSSRCNGGCVTCPREGMTRYQGELSRELFVKGTDGATSEGWVLDYCHFHLNGEPLYLPIDELVWRINYAREKLLGNPCLCFFTNASLLTPEISDKLLDSALTKIVFSIDGGTKEVFEICRKGLNWDTVVSNIACFMDKARQKQSRIQTQTAFIPTTLNYHTLPQYYKLFSQLGIQDVGGSGVNNIGGLLNNAKDLRRPEQYAKGNRKSPCWRIFIDLSILADGRVCLCCQDVRGMCIVGDLNKQTISEIWTSEAFENIRAKHLEMKQEDIPFCADCDYMESFCVDKNLEDWWPGAKK